eukprot:909636-Pleurochrysis_carterae.AAC.1
MATATASATAAPPGVAAAAAGGMAAASTTPNKGLKHSPTYALTPKRSVVAAPKLNLTGGELKSTRAELGVTCSNLEKQLQQLLEKHYPDFAHALNALSKHEVPYLLELSRSVVDDDLGILE